MKEENFKLHKNALYGSTVYKMYDVDFLNALIEGLTALKSLAYCRYHDVATGVYECPYAEVVNNSIVCNHTCIYNSKNCNIEYEHTLDDEDIVDYPF